MIWTYEYNCFGDLQWKTTSNIKYERRTKILKVKYLNIHWLDLSQILNQSFCEQINNKNVTNEDDLQWKTTSNIKIDLSQQPLAGSSPNFKLKLM